MSKTLYELGIYNTEKRTFANISDETEEVVQGEPNQVIEQLQSEGWKDIAVTEFKDNLFNYFVHFVRPVEGKADE